MSRPAPTVLVIDDAEDMHDLIAVRLAPEGIRVLGALDAARGEAIARAERPDLILLDFERADEDGLATCRRLTADPELGAIPLAFLTASAGEAFAARARAAGARATIAKPFDGPGLRAAVRALLSPPGG
jgi:CheY-like chemotaxis protein